MPTGNDVVDDVDDVDHRSADLTSPGSPTPVRLPTRLVATPTDALVGDHSGLPCTTP
ncbi:hypothetical protein ACWGRK_04315 [Saccharomonospora azurea]